MQLDATKELETAAQFRIRGYPTVLLIYQVYFSLFFQCSHRFLCMVALAQLQKWQIEPERR